MKPILFIDFDGTLCHDLFWRSLPKENLQKIKLFEFDDNHIAERWMRGEFTSEEINKRIAESVEMPYEELWKIFVDNCKTMTVSQEILNKLQDLRSKYHVVLMTDNMDCFDRFTVPALSLDKYFDAIVNSYNVKAGKKDNNGKSFLDVVEKFNSTTENSILIDNSVSTCEVFNALGGKPLIVTPTESLDYWLKRFE